MNRAINISSSKKSNYGFLTILAVFILLISFSGYIFYQIIPKPQNTFFAYKGSQNVYILLSQDNEAYLKKINVSETNYIDIIKRFQKRLSAIGIKSKLINDNDISELKKNDVLIALDTYNLSNDTFNDIKDFLSKGGNLIFNYHFGYFINNYFVKQKPIEEITSLKYISESSREININFFIPKILSPIIRGENSQRYDLVLYSSDTIPLFESKHIPDAILTNWEITTTPILNKKMLTTEQSGILWHGFYGKGKWFYFSVPSYTFLDLPKSFFKKLFGNIISYFTETYTIAKYPFLDHKNAIFISEDTEFKYENMIHFAKASKNYDIPVTMFCVAKFALQYKNITKEAATFPNVEIGSHSYSHGKIMGEPLKKVIKEIKGSKEILEKITGKRIYGFRPPREEIDQTMVNILKESGYEYVMEKTKPYLLPEEEYKGLITIPRHGTDDYIFLINLDWDKERILQKIIQEAQMLTSLNALYTLSVHTHLLSYKSNLDVTKKFFEFLKEHKNLHPLNGVEIARRALLKEHIKITKQQLNENTFIYIKNDNEKEVKNFSFRIYWPNSEEISVIPEISSTKIKILEVNDKRKYTDVRILKIPPKTTVSLIIEE